MRFGRHMHMDRWCFHRVHKSRINMYETVCIEIIRYYLVSFYTRIVAIFFSYTLAGKFYVNFDADRGRLLIPASMILGLLCSFCFTFNCSTIQWILIFILVAGGFYAFHCSCVVYYVFMRRLRRNCPAFAEDNKISIFLTERGLSWGKFSLNPALGNVGLFKRGIYVNGIYFKSSNNVNVILGAIG